MKHKNKGFVLLFLAMAIFIVALGTLGYFLFKNSKKVEIKENTQNLKEPAASESYSKVATPNPTGANPAEISWVGHDSNRGFSFKHPEGWDIVYALGSEYIEVDVKNPEKDALILISIRSDEKIENKLNIEEAVLEREKDVKSNENYKVLSFKSLVEGNSGSYTALGEEQYFVFAENKNLDELSVTTYKFQERGFYKVGKKTVVLHGMALPGSPNESVVTQIIESFELK